MAEDGKKPISVEMKISPFRETKSKKAPEWFAARPKLVALFKDIPVKRTMKLDPRKWKKKVLEDGAIAVARYELAFLANVLSNVEKKIAKALPKDQKRKKFTKNTKDESKEEAAVLDAAAAELTGVYKKFSKAIEDKISLAFDEVESDKGDNKQALAAGKEALKRFDGLETNDMFSHPTNWVVETLEDLSSKINGDGDKEAFKEAARSLSNCKKEFRNTAKEAQNVVKYLLSQGEKMAKNDKAAPELKSVGQSIKDNKSKLDKLVKNVDSFEKELTEVVKIVDGGKASSAALSTKATNFDKSNSKRDGDVDDAVKAMRIVAKKFNAVAKDLKS